MERKQFTGRSGDTHVIDPRADHAEAVNIDQRARDLAAKAKAKPQQLDDGPASADPLDHDGDGKKGGMKGVAAKAG